MQFLFGLRTHNTSRTMFQEHLAPSTFVISELIPFLSRLCKNKQCRLLWVRNGGVRRNHACIRCMNPEASDAVNSLCAEHDLKPQHMIFRSTILSSSRLGEP